MHVNCHTSFIVRGDAHVCDNSSTHSSRDNINLKSILRDVGIDAIALPACRPKLNSIELVFNATVQRFASRLDELTLNSNDDVLFLLNSVIESIAPNIMFSCCIEYGHRNFN